MPSSVHTLVAVLSLALSCQAFLPTTRPVVGTQLRQLEEQRRVVLQSTVTDSPVAEAPVEAPPLSPPTTAELSSVTGADFLPLATALMTSDYKEADKLTRELLIYIAGPGARGRKYVYFSEVQFIPAEDLATMENLWLKYSGGKFGYSVQRFFYNQATKQDRGGQEGFEKFCRKIGWSLVDDELERKRRWFGEDEFIYELEAAPKGHLPLTSALRGTQLMKALFKHPVWEREEFAASGKGKYDK